MERAKHRHLLGASVRAIRGSFCIFKCVPTVVLVLSFSVAFVASAQTTELFPEREQGALLYRQGNLEGAITALRLATKKHKTDSLAWHYLGLALSDSGNLKDARKAFEKTIKLTPDFAASHTALAYVFMATAKVNEAEIEVRRALSLDRTDARAHFVFGTILLRKNDCQGALDQAEAVQANESKLAVGYLLKSQALICQQSYRGIPATRVEGTVATKSQPTRSKEEISVAAKHRANTYGEAADNLDKYLQLEPNGFEAAMWREQIKTLRVFAELGAKPVSERTIFAGPELTTKARVLGKPEPQYTEAARRAQVVGTVVLRAVFAADGSVQHILAVTSLPYGLTQQAIAAARKIKFIPATRNGQPASMYIQLEYNFNLY